MTCYRIGGDSPGFVCIADRPWIVVKNNGRVYRFERSAACGLLPVNANGDQRLSPVPGIVWDVAAKIEARRRRAEAVMRKLQSPPEGTP